MFACTTMGGMALGAPDVCKTPAPPSPSPVPIPYPNTAQLPTTNPGTCTNKVLIMNMPAVTKSSEIPATMGDNAGVAGGVSSGVVMGPAKFNMGSNSVKFEGNPPVRMLDPTGHNGSSPNVPAGSVLAPSQTKVMIMS